MNNLFNYTSTNKINISIYCDEIKKEKDSISGNYWDYIGLLLTPTTTEIETLQELEKHRCKRNLMNDAFIWKSCPNNCSYHNKNDKIVHYSELDADKYHIAQRWYDYIISINSTKKIFLYVTGINRSLLDSESFGGSLNFNIVYNRFFRSALIYAIKKFFGSKYKKIIVDKIIHEDGEQMASEIFPWHPIYKIGKSFQNITFIDEEIKFISDDHKIDWSANFIQLTDLFLGVVKNYFHNSSQKEHKIKITKKFLPLIERIIQNPYNFRSSYNYYNRIDINFFPKKNLQFNNTDYSTFDELYKSILRTYYKDRTSDFINRQQLPLF